MAYIKSVTDAAHKAIAQAQYDAKRQALDDFVVYLEKAGIELPEEIEAALQKFKSGLELEKKPKSTRPRNAYNEFMSETIKQLKKDNPEMKAIELMKTASKMYGEHKAKKKAAGEAVSEGSVSGDEVSGVGVSGVGVEGAGKKAAGKGAGAAGKKKAAGAGAGKKKKAVVDELVEDDVTDEVTEELPSEEVEKTKKEAGKGAGKKVAGKKVAEKKAVPAPMVDTEEEEESDVGELSADEDQDDFGGLKSDLESDDE